MTPSGAATEGSYSRGDSYDREDGPTTPLAPAVEPGPERDEESKRAAKELAKAVSDGGVKWKSHPKRLGGGVFHGRARWKGDALVIHVQAEPPFEFGQAHLGELEGEIQQNGMVVFKRAQERFGDAREVTCVFTEADSDFPMIVTVEVE